jgi:serine/threonine protein phosphatase 1
MKPKSPKHRAIVAGNEMPEPLFYAISDIHGCHELLERLWLRIECDALRLLAPGAKATVVFLGDYIDRGPDSVGVVEWCARLQRRPPPWCAPVFLLGNHEQMMFDFLETRDKEGLGFWVENGGGATLDSLEIGAGTPKQIAALLFRAGEQRGLLKWFLTLRFHHRAAGYLFVHAGIEPGVALAKQDPMECLWIREEFLDSSEDHGFRVVHGHTPTSSGCVEVLANRVNVDTGACYSGVLSAVRLRGKDVGILQVKAPATRRGKR